MIQVGSLVTVDDELHVVVGIDGEWLETENVDEDGALCVVEKSQVKEV